MGGVAASRMQSTAVRFASVRVTGSQPSGSSADALEREENKEGMELHHLSG